MKSKIIPTIAEQIEILQKRNGLKAEERAQIAGIPYSSYRRKLSNGTLTMAEVESIANYFGYEVNLTEK